MNRILVVAASSIMRAGLEALVAQRSGLAVLGSSLGMPELAHQVEALSPDALLWGLNLRNPEAIQELSLLSASLDPPAIIALSEYPNGSLTRTALRYGVRAILPLEASSDEIIATVVAVGTGLLVLHPDALDSVSTILSATTPSRAANTTEALTPRESEILTMLAEGLGNKAIAGRLGISDHTVKFHLSSIFTKLRASSRTEAVTLGLRQGLIML